MFSNILNFFLVRLSFFLEVKKIERVSCTPLFEFEFPASVTFFGHRLGLNCLCFLNLSIILAWLPGRRTPTVGKLSVSYGRKSMFLNVLELFMK